MRKKMNKRATRKAFTLVELVIVIAVIGILASVLIPTFASVINSAKDNASIQQATNARDEYITTYLISPEEAIGLLIETPRDWFIVNKSCEVEKINIEDYDLNQYEKLPDIPTIKDVHIYRKRNTDIYTITFLVRDGNIVGNKKVYTMYNTDKMYSDYELTQESTIPTAEGNKIGYNSVFLGWQYGNAEVGVLVINADGTFTNENIKSIFKDGKFNVESDINLYARFDRTPIEYNINYILNDGTNNEDNPLTYTIEDEIVLKDATKQNYTFKGWYTDIEFNGSPITKIAKGTINDITLYAKFVEGEEATYKVEYYQENIENEEYTLFETVSDLVGATGATVTADIKTYEGFTQNTEKIAEASGQVIFDGSLVLRVYYNRNIYTITWNIDGDTSNTEPYKYGAMPTYKGETPTKEQDNLKTYKFKTWYPTIEEVKGEQTYTARFEETARKYDVIIYDINKVEKLRRVYSCDTEFDLTTINLEQEGYEFLGLTTEENIGTTNYVTKIAVDEWGEKKFYANYNVETYTITYNLNGGVLETGKTNPTTYTVETETFTLNNPSKVGYTFTGWTGSNITNAQTTVTISKGATGNLTYTANYNVETYTITYNLNGGALATGKTNPTTYTVETETFTLNNPSKTGYTFTGWTGSNIATAQTIVTISKGTTGNLTYTANYNVETYTITYNLNGGALATGKTNPTTYTVETETFTLNNPSKTGYTFTGWTGSNITNTQTTVTINKGTTGNLTYTANYNVETYTITYNLNGGVLETGKTNPTTYTVETETFTLNNPSKTGYTFTGWTGSNIATAQTTVTINKGTIGNLTYTANYNVETYTITYNLNGGVLATGKTNPTTYTVETETFTLNNPSKTGYTFTGWTGSNIATAQTTVTINKGTTGNLIFTANYDIETYTITYNLNGGVLATGKTNPTTYTVETETFTLNNPSKTGYTFTGWTGSNITTAQTTVTISKGTTGNLTYTANYNVETYTITYNLNGGVLATGRTNPTTYTVETETFTLNNPSKTGYTFTGWTGSNIATAQTTVTINKGTTGNLTYTANYNVETYTITYNLNGGALATGKTNPTTYTVETETFTLNNPSKTGYTFKGWTGSNIATAQTTVTINKGTTGNLTFTANYNVEPYTITYTLNGGTNNSANPSSYNIETATITLLDATKDGCTFDGWYSDSTFKTKVTTIAKGSTGNKVLYAKFVNFTTKETNGQLTITGYTGSDTDITIPSTINGKKVIAIGDKAFYNNADIQSVIIDDGITSIGNSVFMFCSSLTSITIPNTITSIGSEAFSSCRSLTGITIPDSVTSSIGNSTFMSCESLISVIIGNNVTSIGDNAFESCESLASVTIGSSVTSIGESAFNSCYDLTSIVIPNSVTSIGDSAFDGCGSLISVTIGSGVKLIGNNAFSSCEELTSIVIPNGLTSIGEYAFGYCYNLTSITIPDSVTSIGNGVFYNCENLDNVTIGSGITSIADNAFGYCSGLARINIPDSVTSIGNSAFRNCKSLPIITIPNSVTSIGNGAFANCTRFTGITIPSSVSFIGINAFYCSNLESIKFKAPNHWKAGSTSVSASDLSNDSTAAYYLKQQYKECAWTKDVASMFTTTESNGELIITEYIGLDTIVTVPSTINGKKVTTIGGTTFTNNKKVNTVIISNGITTIGMDSFQYCGLTSVVIPSSVTTIEENVFNDCTSLTSVTMSNGLTTIYAYAFQGCTSLKNITIPDSVTTIGAYAFDGCTSLTDVVFENPNGWVAARINNGNILTSNNIEASYLANSTTAATYLKSTLSQFYFLRK